MTASHSSVVSLSGQMTRRTSSSDLRRRARQGRGPPRRVVRRVAWQGQPEGARAVGDLERRKGVHVHLGHRVLHGRHDLKVGVAAVLGVDAARRHTSVAPAARASRVRRAISSRSSRYATPRSDLALVPLEKAQKPQ